ncbi:MAG: DUF378 domain-containing protein [Clostridia bacterium]|nr:DUF378 domain-containing protein [Clostridia bacterium]
MIILNWISYVLALTGALNWGLVGIFDFNLVGWIFGGTRSVGAIIVYILVAIAAIWLIISPIVTGRGLLLSTKTYKEGREDKPVTENY